MRRTLEGKRIIVTGASSGIGYCLSQRLARKGAQVLATARRTERLLQLQKETRCSENKDQVGTLDYLAGDLTDPAVRQALMQVVEERWGGCLDGLINNAGIGAIGPFSQASSERLERILEVDLVAPLELTRSAFARLKKGNQPFVMMVGSVLGHRAVPWKSEYCAAKFALRGFAESLRIEWLAEGIDVLHVSPSTTDSEFFDSLVQTEQSSAGRSWMAMSPDAVAGTIVRAIQGRKRDRIISLGGKGLVWMGKWFPNLMDSLLSWRLKPRS